jgi:hypothetical protein
VNTAIDAQVYFLCAICAFPTQRCPGHIGMREPYRTAADRRWPVSHKRYLAAEIEYEAQYQKWRGREMADAAVGKKLAAGRGRK